MSTIDPLPAFVVPTGLFFRQYHLECLSLFSYLIGDTTTGRAVVVDPQRDISGYLADAEANGLRIERVIETHFHADFVSGHLEMARATGAMISYGSEARTDFEIDPLSHGQILELGAVQLEIRHTPGHTPEAISIVLSVPQAGDVKRDQPWAVLTGDTLFIGDVGRPDLLTSVGRSADSLARDLFASLHEQILTLPDATLVLPAHGAGSACGKRLENASSSTIGEQREFNYALAPMSVTNFVDLVTEGQSVAPLYFAFAADANRRDRPSLDEHSAPALLSLEDLLAYQSGGAVVLDTRSADVFASGHLRGSVNVGLDGRFAEYAGDVLRPGQRVVLVAEEDRAVEARVRLARIGFDNVIGAFPDVAQAISDRPELKSIAQRLNAGDLVTSLVDDGGATQIVDVRNPSEANATGTIPNAIHMPLPQLLDQLDRLDPSAPTVVYCAGGYRSSIAASTLRAHGFKRVADITGGFAAWQTATTLPAT